MRVRNRSGLAAAGLATVAVGAALLGQAPPARAQAGVTFRKHVIAFDLPNESLVPADFDGDGVTDVAASAADEVGWYQKTAGRAFWRKFPMQKRTAETGSLRSIFMQAYDVDGDGDRDLLTQVSDTGNLAWLENVTPTAPWRWHLIDNLPGIHGMALEDLNRDGRPELIANSEGALVWYTIPRNPKGLLPASYKGDPAGRQMWDRKYLSRSGVTGKVHYMNFADLDGDGDRDLCTASPESGFLAWWERPSDATLIWTRHLVKQELPGATHCIPADVDKDGKLDLVYARGHAAGIGWLAGPDWKQERVIDAESLNNPHAVSLADLDGDGDLDVVGIGRGNSRVAWFRNDGKGDFQREEIDEEQSGGDVRALDMDGDGDLDLLVAGEKSKNVLWYENLRL